MSLLANNVLTLADWAKRFGPDGKISTVIELLSQNNDVLDDMLWKEGNLATGDRTTIRTGLPTTYWRMINQGVPTSKSRTAQVDETCGNLEAWSECDKLLAELGGDINGFRLSEAQAFIEAMNQEMVQTLFYGNVATSPEEFAGLSPRYSSLSPENRQNIISGGGVGSDNCSIWLVVWGANTVHGIFPKGTKAGLTHEDLGLVTVETVAGVGGNRMRAYQDHWTWQCGVALKDWRYVARICNLDVSNLVAKTTPADLTELMIKATHRIPNMNAGRPVFYMNRTCFQMLDIQRRDDVGSGGQLGYDSVDGKRVPMFRGIPIRVIDQLLETEAVVA